MSKSNHAAEALIKPIDTAVLPPKTNPLDGSVVLQTANQNSLATDNVAEELTTPEASFSHTELESLDDEQTFITDTDEGRASTSTSQSTLSGGTFHTTQLESGDYADSDESQQWQITQTERGTGTVER